jgi:RHS repeat-associated protein
MGRAFLSLAYNRYLSGGSPVESHDRTLSEIDVEGNIRSITDALGRTVMTYDYDMLGTRIRTNSVDAGERWILNDVSSKAYLGWDSRGHQLRHEYDAARRPTGLFVQTGASPELLAEKTVYGEGQPTPAQDQAMNLRGKVYQQFDAAGVVNNNQYDFKGNLLNSSRELLNDYKDQVDWSTAQSLTGETFTVSSTFDALNRPVTSVTPDGSVIRPIYNEASLLEQIAVNLRGAASATTFVSDIEYNAKAQRLLIAYGNGSQTSYSYDPNTFRLVNLTTIRAFDNATLRALGYTYDPVGNITHIVDGAQQTVFFSNQIIDPSNDYIYDALYRLIQARGRELIGLAGQPQTTWNDAPRMTQALPLPSNAQALRTYTEAYVYDGVGNILSLAHQAAGGNWTRTYAYDEPNSPPTNNRLTSTTVGATKEQPYTYDAHGNMTAMPHLSLMAWDFKDELQATQQRVASGPVETTYYVYDSAGQRVRKVTETANATPAHERIYFGGYELYREFDAGGNATLARETVQIMDDKRRVALVETTTIDAEAPPNSLPSTATRYQFDNHLGSACLELDEDSAVISYEEYYPYGGSSYQAGRSAAEVSLKRYRYTGKERDEETGLYYHGARYYAPWLGRWTSCDPAGPLDTPNVFQFVRGNPVTYTDPSGHNTEKTGQIEKDVENFQTKVTYLKRWRDILERLQREKNEVLKEFLEQAKPYGTKLADKLLDLTTRYRALARDVNRWKGELLSLGRKLQNTIGKAIGDLPDSGYRDDPERIKLTGLKETVDHNVRDVNNVPHYPLNRQPPNKPVPKQTPSEVTKPTVTTTPSTPIHWPKPEGKPGTPIAWPKPEGKPITPPATPTVYTKPITPPATPTTSPTNLPSLTREQIDNLRQNINTPRPTDPALVGDDPRDVPGSESSPTPTSTGVTAAATTIVVLEVVKWGIAILAAPETGGGSLVGAAALP